MAESEPDLSNPIEMAKKIKELEAQGIEVTPEMCDNLRADCLRRKEERLEHGESKRTQLKEVIILDRKNDNLTKEMFKVITEKEQLNEFEKKLIEQIKHTKTHEHDFSKDSPIKIAKEKFGYVGFKPRQEEIINFILNKKGNAMGILPTGGGKSACFQIPALIQKNMTLVVSPLIALMKDQVEMLWKKGIHAFFINSSIDYDIKEQIIELIEENKVKLLYIAPESLQSERIKEILSKQKIDSIVIDEAHCISTWGHDFRPDYLKLAEIINELGSPPVLALTATATNKVIIDIQKQLKRKFEVFKASFDRPLLYLVVHNVPDDIDKEIFLLNLIKKLKGPTIIFAATQASTANLAEMLNKNGIKSIFYHAGLSSEERAKTQELFMNGECDIIIATIAFGMGIDKKDIRNVIHYNIPQSVEGYYQEIGRAGRDGDKSNCILLYTGGDVNSKKRLIAFDWPNKKKIENIINYLKDKNSRFLFINHKNLGHELDIKETPIKLIFHRLEEAGAIKKYSSVIHDIKIKFNKPYESIISDCEDEYKADITLIFNSEYFKHVSSRVNFEELMGETKLNPFRVKEIFDYLSNNKDIDILEKRYKDLILIKKELASFDIAPLIKIFDDILSKNYKKVDDLVDCLKTKGCIRKKILSYFDEPNLKNNCEMCSNCVSYELIESIPKKINENHTTDKEINTLGSLTMDAQKDELHTLLLKSIIIDKIIPKKDCVKIMKGDLHKFSAKWKFNLKSYGILKEEEQNEIEDALNKLISDNLVEVTSRDELRITKKGIQMLPKMGGKKENVAMPEDIQEEKIITKETEQDKSRYEKKVEEIKMKYAQAYEPWTLEKERELTRFFNENIKISEIAKLVGRQPGAVRSRLKKLGLIK